MTHPSCTQCRLRFAPGRTPELEACPTCGGPLTPLRPGDALGFAFYRAPAVSAPAWTTALAQALDLPPHPARR